MRVKVSFQDASEEHFKETFENRILKKASFTDNLGTKIQSEFSFKKLTLNLCAAKIEFEIIGRWRFLNKKSVLPPNCLKPVDTFVWVRCQTH